MPWWGWLIVLLSIVSNVIHYRMIHKVYKRVDGLEQLIRKKANFWD